MIGVDKHINEANTKLLSKLTGLTGYGRAYIVVKDNQGNEQTVPEYLVSGTSQYKSVTPDNKLKGSFFFVVRNDYAIEDDSYVNTVQVDIFFSVNLKKMYPNVSERAIEYLHKDVLNELKYTKFNVNAINSGLESHSEFDYVKNGDNLQPYYLCRFETTIEYNINEC